MCSFKRVAYLPNIPEHMSLGTVQNIVKGIKWENIFILSKLLKKLFLITARKLFVGSLSIFLLYGESYICFRFVPSGSKSLLRVWMGLDDLIKKNNRLNDSLYSYQGFPILTRTFAFLHAISVYDTFWDMTN